MGRLLLNLRNVPEDEHLEVRELLDAHGIPYYETPPNRWLISFGAIWLRDEGRGEEALALLRDYQKQRQDRERARYEVEYAQGRVNSAEQYRRHPLRYLLSLVGIGVVLYLALVPFVTF